MAKVRPCCSAAVRLAGVPKMNSGSASVPGIKFSGGVQKSVPAWDVECDSSSRKFVLAKFGDPERLLSTAHGFRNILPELSNKNFMEHVTYRKGGRNAVSVEEIGFGQQTK